MKSVAVLRKNGFTLIELLVVVAIIAVLAGILIPVFSMVRGQARQVQCLSNLRQLGIGMLTYAGDNRGCVPCGQVPSPDRNVLGLPMFGMWYSFIQPYLSRSTDGAPMYWCPVSCFSLKEVRAMPDYNAVQSSYAINSPDALSNRKWYARQLAVVPNPDQTVMLGEKWAADNSGSAIAPISASFDPPGKATVVSGPRRPGVWNPACRANHPNNKSTDPTLGRTGVCLFSGRVQMLRWQDSCIQTNSWLPPNQWRGIY